MISGQDSLRIAGQSQQVFAGVSFVRHDYELSCLLLAGENPALHSEEEILNMPSGVSAPGREALKPAPDLTVKDRYLDGYPTFAKVILLTRLDLRARKHDVRYVNLDDGLGFTVFTDDGSVYGGLPLTEVNQLRRWALDALLRYEDLFSALSSMIYLPAFFAAYPNNVQELEVVTELEGMRDEATVRETIKHLGGMGCTTHRNIHCLTLSGGTNDEAMAIGRQLVPRKWAKTRTANKSSEGHGFLATNHGPRRAQDPSSCSETASSPMVLTPERFTSSGRQLMRLISTRSD
jgi:hypothetical protein